MTARSARASTPTGHTRHRAADGAGNYQGYFLAVFGTSSVLGPVIGGFFAGMSTFLDVSRHGAGSSSSARAGSSPCRSYEPRANLQNKAGYTVASDYGTEFFARGLLLLVAELDLRVGLVLLDATNCYASGRSESVAFQAIESATDGRGRVATGPAVRNTKTIGTDSLAMSRYGALRRHRLSPTLASRSQAARTGTLAAWLLPLTLGIMSGSVISGQTISRTGRYRSFLRAGGPMIAVALFILHWTRYDTALWKLMIVMVLFGMGMGFMMQPLMLAIQAAAERRDMGIATASATFTRQIGGMLGRRSSAHPLAARPELFAPGWDAQRHRGVQVRARRSRQCGLRPADEGGWGLRRIVGDEGLLLPLHPRPQARQAIPQASQTPWTGSSASMHAHGARSWAIWPGSRCAVRRRAPPRCSDPAVGRQVDGQRDPSGLVRVSQARPVGATSPTGVGFDDRSRCALRARPGRMPIGYRGGRP